jgi:ATP-dependent DNA helicase RecQ
MSSRRTTPKSTARVIAAQVFGHASLLPGQEEAMNALLEGHDVLLVAPTGAGKSLTYQVPAVALEGCTVVVSPLLALQRDQLEGLQESGERTQAVRISSEESAGQRDEAFRKLVDAESEFLFLSPEQLARPEVNQRVAALRPSLVAVDEAHCVSAWGHDFRPDYFRVGELVESIGRPRVIAMTATAAPPVRDDIANRLRLRDLVTIVRGFGRDNLTLSVRPCHGAESQAEEVLAAVRRTVGPGIVYCRTRRATEDYASALAEAGCSVAPYHAGLGKKQRVDTQRRFMTGEIDVIVATSAFGMGIDKPDIRYVFHAHAPESLDTCYQEFGRGGRDGRPASAVLFYRPEDLALGRFFSSAPPKHEDVTAVVAALEADPGASRQDLRHSTGFGAQKLGRILNLVDETTATSDAPLRGAALVDAVVDRGEAHRRLERSRVEMMRAYAETDRCRWEFILGYFGEPGAPCGHCDNCEAGLVQPEQPRSTGYAPQSRVSHREFGDGTVMDEEDGQVTVLFDDSGYRTLALDIVTAEGLMTTLS